MADGAAPPPKRLKSTTTAAALVTPPETTFTWVIEDLTAASFTGAARNETWRCEEEFVALGVRWRLHIARHIMNSKNVPCVTPMLQLVSPNCEVWPAPIQYTLAGLTTTSEGDVVFNTQVPRPAGAVPCWSLCPKVTHAQLSANPKFLPDGKLTVTVSLRARSFAELPVRPPPEPTLRADMRALLESGEGVDVTIRAGDETFAAHSFVLALHSTTLKAQLWGAMARGPPHEITVLDNIAPPIFKEVLDFMYDGDLDFVSHEEAQHLLHAADYFGVARLRDLCESILHSGLTAANVVPTLLVAHQCSSSDLCSTALRFIAAHSAAVMLTSDWRVLMAHQVLGPAAVHTMAHGEPPTLVAPHAGGSGAGDA